MSFPAGSARERTVRPTQFHGVSYDERALDPSGNRLPWALEFPEGHQNSRNLRKATEEKGSFGRSTKKKTGSVRGTTRTQTPAKSQGYPGLDGFEAALKFDASHRQSTQQPQPSQAGSGDATRALPAARDAVPTEVLLYGFSSETQWAAISFFENASGGMICEDYERNPPEERRRYQGGLGMAGAVRARRTLSKREAQLAMVYRGGNCWIKVTFDSKEAAERAIAAGPHLVQGNWVHAAAWKGQGPEMDEPIPVEDEDRQEGGLASPRPRRDVVSHFRRPSGIPASPDVRTTPGRSSSNMDIAVDESPMSSTTASSATATAPETGLRQRNATGIDPALSGSMKLFQDQRKTILRPPTEALLPTPTWSERFWTWLTANGLVPGEVIGSTVPRLDSGEFDWNAASYYWQFVKWLDDILGTDMCGLKAD